MGAKQSQATREPRKPGPKPPDATVAIKKDIVRHYADCGTLREACKRADADYFAALGWKTTDPAFTLALQAAEEPFRDEIERVALERAKDGSDKVLLHVLKCLHRDKYGEVRRMEHSGPGGQPITIHSLDQVRAQLVAVAHQFPTIAPRLREGLQAILDALPKQE